MQYRDVPWHLGGCVGTDSKAWALRNGGESILPMLERICNGCTIKTMCGEYADEHDEYGFWGGKMRWENDVIASLHKEHPEGGVPDVQPATIGEMCPVEWGTEGDDSSDTSACDPGEAGT